jgi:hypothetical protein
VSAASSFAVRARLVADATTSLPQTLKSLQHLVGVATGRFEAQMETARECAMELQLLDAQLGEFVHRRAPALDPQDAAFLIRARHILRLLQARLDGAAS